MTNLHRLYPPRASKVVTWRTQEDHYFTLTLSETYYTSHTSICIQHYCHVTDQRLVFEPIRTPAWTGLLTQVCLNVLMELLVAMAPPHQAMSMQFRSSFYEARADHTFKQLQEDEQRRIDFKYKGQTYISLEYTDISEFKNDTSGFYILCKNRNIDFFSSSSWIIQYKNLKKPSSSDLRNAILYAQGHHNYDNQKGRWTQEASPTVPVPVSRKVKTRSSQSNQSGNLLVIVAVGLIVILTAMLAGVKIAEKLFPTSEILIEGGDEYTAMPPDPSSLPSEQPSDIARPQRSSGSSLSSPTRPATPTPTPTPTPSWSSSSSELSWADRSRLSEAEKIKEITGISVDWTQYSYNVLLDARLAAEESIRLYRLTGVQVDWTNTSYLEMQDMRLSAEESIRLYELTNVKVDWMKYSYLSVLDMRQSAEIILEINARTGHNYDWRDFTFLEALDFKYRLGL